MRSPDTRYQRPLLLFLVVLLAGCGFRLAGTADLPAAYSTINLADSGFNSVQRKLLVDRLQGAGATLVTGANTAAPTLVIRLFGLTEKALFETGDREQTKRLILQLGYQIRATDGASIQEERILGQENDFEVDLFNIVASEREKDELQEQMLNQLISRMIYQLQRM